MYTHGDGFSGILGFALAFQWAGFKMIWSFDKNPFCQQVQQRHFPDAKQLGDIFDVHHPGYVDVFTAGFPCQPFSGAGRGQGDRDERYLIPEMLGVISEVMPRVVLLENVPRFTVLDDGIYFKRLLRSLAEMGYDAQWGRIRASDVGAPHQRERWLLVAYAQSARLAQRGYRPGQNQGAHRKASKKRFDARPHRRSNFTQKLCHSQRGGRSRHPRRGAGQEPAHRSTQRERFNQSRLGRDVNGFPYRLDIPVWPAPLGTQPLSEPPRTAPSYEFRYDRVEAIGNAVVPQVILPIAVAIREWLEEQDA